MTIATKIIPHGSTDYEEIVRLRDEMLRKPLGLNFSPEELAKEHDSHHMAVLVDGRIVGGLVLAPLTSQEIKMRQVAVAKDKQGLGVGKVLVRAAEDFARKNNFLRMKLNARDTAVRFYTSCGYETVGEVFTEVGIPHRSMQKNLNP